MRFSFQRTKRNIVVEAGTLFAFPLSCKIETLSETGPLRNHNEDTIGYHFFNNNHSSLIAIVADGMGGHAAGEVASKIACNTVLTEAALTRDNNAGIDLDAILKIAHQEIIKAAQEDVQKKGMGTTATVLLLQNGKLNWAHVGDSRLYQLSNGTLQQLTTDHTFVNQLFKKGAITKEETTHHSMKNVLVQALGTIPVIQPETGNAIAVQDADKFLLCSDGLYDVFSDTELCNFLQMNDTKLASDSMRLLALERKASDNFSALIISLNRKPHIAIPDTKELNVLL